MRLDFCALCGERDGDALEHHHFIPRALGGSDDESNMFTVCGTCHGKIHAIPRPTRLGELVKAGVAKAQERTAAEYRQIADQSTRRADKATELAQEAERTERRKARLGRPRLVSSTDGPKQPTEWPRPTLAVIGPILYGTQAMQKDKQFRRVGDWGLAGDGAQWVLQRKNGKSWEGISFIRTLKVYLAGCMGGKGVPSDAAAQLLDGLTDCFDAWMDAQHDLVSRQRHHPAPESSQSLMMATDAPLSSLAA